jgi:tetratricopeptide (TPR) repeat protein
LLQALVKLAEKLDGLPLALATAGAFLDQEMTSFASYLDLYEESWLQLQETSPGLYSYQDRVLYSTWQLSFNQINQQNPLSTKLLQLWAYFDNQDLWFELLKHELSDTPEWFAQLTKDNLSFTQAVEILCDYGLVERSQSLKGSRIESRGYSMHSCVHSWTIHVLNQKRDPTMAKIALECVGSHAPNHEKREYWVTQNRLIRHATQSWDMVKGVEKVCGPEHTTTLDTVSNLGNLYADQGKIDRAEKMYDRALQGYEKAWGPEHPSTLGTVKNLGNLYHKQGKMHEAENMYERTLQGYEYAWGEEHYSSMLRTVNNLGSVYADQGKMDKAEKMYDHALQGYEKAWGPEHALTLTVINNLGTLYADHGNMDKAERMYDRALKGDEKAWGPEHTSTLSTVNNLGLLYADQGKMNKAETMHHRALQGYEKSLGHKQVKTYTPALTAMKILAELYMQLGQANKAKDMYSRALNGLEEVFGPSSKQCQDIVAVLAILRGDSCDSLAPWTSRRAGIRKITAD